jgi:NAD(P)-dependent dehydrogenase (short-subunit alcohol dehydrogenase family)
MSTRLRPPARLRCEPDGSASPRLHLKEEAMGRKILITGAGSGLGEGTAIGLARNGYDVIATAQTWPQVTALRLKSKALALPTVRVEKLDLLDPYDVARACKWDFNILVNNAGIGEGGPIAEIPLDLVRRNFEVNVFAPLSNPACRKKLGCGRDPREDRLRIVNGRPLQSAGLLHNFRNIHPKVVEDSLKSHQATMFQREI